MSKLVKVSILAVISFAMFASEAFAGRYSAWEGGKTGKSGKTTSGKATGGKTMEDTFGPSKPLVPQSLAKTAVKTVIWDGQKVTIRSGQVFDGFVPELSYGTIDGCSNMYRVCNAPKLNYKSSYPVEGGKLVVYGDGYGDGRIAIYRIVFSEKDKDAYCETFKKIGECMVQVKRTRAKSFTKDIPCSVEGSSFVFEWTSKPFGPPPAGKDALTIQRTIDSCRVIVTKTDLVTKAVVSTDAYRPETFGEFLKMLTSKDQDIVSEFNKRNGTPSDAEKNSK